MNSMVRTPARGKNWDYMSGTAIDKMNGLDERPKTDILSGQDATDYLEQAPEDGQVDRLDWETIRCNCEERLTRVNPDAYLPEVRVSGICSGCGVRR